MFKKLVILVIFAIPALCQHSQDAVLDVVSTNKTVQNIIWGYVDSWQFFKKITPPAGNLNVSKIVFSPDCKQLAAATRQTNKIYIFDIATKKLLKPLDLPLNSSYCFSADNRYFYAVSGSDIGVWDTVNYELQYTLFVPCSEPVTYISCAPNGKYLAASDGKTITLWKNGGCENTNAAQNLTIPVPEKTTSTSVLCGLMNRKKHQVAD